MCRRWCSFNCDDVSPHAPQGAECEISLSCQTSTRHPSLEDKLPEKTLWVCHSDVADVLFSQSMFLALYTFENSVLLDSNR